MRFEGSEIFNVPREVVWQGLNDPSVLKQCIPGCEYFVRESATLLKAKAVGKIGFVKLPLTGSVMQSQINAPESCTIFVKGEGGILGHATAEAHIKLVETGPSECRLDYDMETKIGGRLANFSSSVISSVMQSYASRFFARFAAAIAK